jgi:uncharacterized membrane protein
MDDRSRTRPLPPVLENIETIARLEMEFLEKRTPLERVGDAVGAFVGTMWFVALHLVWFIAWVLINTRLIPFIRPFDPFPFMFLSMTVSMEGVLLTTFVLMKQNRMSKRADQRNQLNLQVDMLSEREVTKILQMLAAVCEHMGLQQTAHEPEVRQMSQHTAVDLLANELKKKIPD